VWAKLMVEIHQVEKRCIERNNRSVSRKFVDISYSKEEEA